MTELNRLVVDMANTNFSPFGHGPLTASMGDAAGLALSSLAPGSGSPKSATERVLKVLQYSTPTSSVADPERNLRYASIMGVGTSQLLTRNFSMGVRVWMGLVTHRQCEQSGDRCTSRHFEPVHL